MQKTHNFKESMENALEDVIDKFLQELKYDTVEANREDQRKGIDRWLNGNTPVEYKTEWRVSDTGNFFIETVSVLNATQNKTGWIHYSEAEYIVYYLPKENFIFFVTLEELRKALPLWVVNHKTTSAQNKGYISLGILVPRKEVEALAFKTYNIKEGLING